MHIAHFTYDVGCCLRSLTKSDPVLVPRIFTWSQSFQPGASHFQPGVSHSAWSQSFRHQAFDLAGGLRPAVHVFRRRLRPHCRRMRVLDFLVTVHVQDGVRGSASHIDTSAAGRVLWAVVCVRYRATHMTELISGPLTASPAFGAHLLCYDE